MAVRFEKVIVDLDDRFTRPMAGMAASTAAFRRSLGDADRDIDVFDRNAAKAGTSIDRFSGRLRVLADVASLLGPALVPVGALGVPALAGLSAQFGFAAVGAGTALVAFQGVGTALEALNDAALEPTAENLEKAEQAMLALSPAAQDLTRQLQGMRPLLRSLRDTAAEGMFPGLSEGLESLESVLPRVQRIVAAVSAELGDISADVGESLASDRWAPFLDFIATDAPPALRDMATAIGHVTHGMAEMWMAFDPLNDDFSSWMVNATRDFDRWASGLSQTEGFQEFVDYIRSTGPQVADTLGSLGNALVQILQAAAPLGGPILRGIEAFADAIAAIADSDLGTPIFGMVAALGALNLALRTSRALSVTAFGGPALAAMKAQGGQLRALRADWAAYSAVQRTAAGRAQATAGQMIASRTAAARLGGTLRQTGVAAAKGAALVGGLAVATSGAADGMKLTNTASLALMGLIAGPWGAALGAGAGLLLDAGSAADDAAGALDRLNAAARSGDLDAMTASIGAAKKQLTDLRNLGGVGDIFETIGQDIGLTLKGKSRAGMIRDYEQGIRRAQEATKKLKAEMAEQAPIRRMAAAITANHAAARKTASQFINLGDSLDDAKVSLNGWIRQMAGQARALTNFGNNARRAADRGLRQGLIKALHEAGPAGAMRMAQLANATDRQIARANRAWAAGRRATRNYTEAVLDVPTDRATRLRVIGALQGISEVRRLQLAVAALRDKTITIRTLEVRRRAGVNSATAMADGGYVSGPGTGRSDSIRAFLSNGEFVVNAAATRRFRAELEWMNAHKYATGGMVSRQGAAPSPTFDYDRLAGAIGTRSGVAPVYNVYETVSASATAAEVARLQSFAGAA